METVNSIKLLRQAEERGQILQLLADMEMTSVGSLLAALDLFGHVVSVESLVSHWRYLEQSGYIRVVRARDLPGWRADRVSEGNPDQPQFAQLLAKGLQLVNGAIEADPMVKF